MSTTVEEPEVHAWTRNVILVVGVGFALFIVAVVIGMVTHPTDHPTILHSWNDFYNWVINSNFAGIFLGLLVPTIPLAVIAEVHHRRTIKRLTYHRALIKEHHELLKEIRDKLDLRDDPPAPTTTTPAAADGS